MINSKAAKMVLWFTLVVGIVLADIALVLWVVGNKDITLAGELGIFGGAFLLHSYFLFAFIYI